MRHSEICRPEHKSIEHNIKSARKTSTSRDTFDVLIMATMSAGKSSLVNALIGQELLHVANEATTACHTRIEHRRGANYFTGTCYSHSNLLLNRQRNISAEQVRDWNAHRQVSQITLAGKFRSRPSPAPGLVLHDTPGPNNSQDDRHAQLAFEAALNVPFKTLLYVLDASQLGTHDDRNILERLRKETAPRSNGPFCFVLNKVDLLDPEKGEDLAEYVAKAQRYLTGIGFDNPVVIPSMANTALYAKKALSNEPLSRAQRMKLQQMLDELALSKRTLLEATRAPSSVKKHVLRSLVRLEKAHKTALANHKSTQKNELRQLIICSGLGVVEAFIKHQRKLSAPA
jgi:tRNA U34 5-carboxymethylaminomethyl modifying GTPase MnmE/TrmE